MSRFDADPDVLVSPATVIAVLFQRARKGKAREDRHRPSRRPPTDDRRAVPVVVLVLVGGLVPSVDTRDERSKPVMMAAAVTNAPIAPRAMQTLHFVDTLAGEELPFDAEGIFAMSIAFCFG